MNKITNATLLKMFCDREIYHNYFKYIQLDWVTKEAKQVLYDFDIFYSSNVGNIDIDAFSLWFFTVRHPEMPASEKEYYNNVFNTIKETESYPPKEVIQKFQEEAIKDKIRETLEDSNFNSVVIKDILENYDTQRELSEDNSGFIAFDLDRILNSTDRSEGLKWRLKFLNDATGGLIQGDLVVVAAYVETGKTMFVVSEAGYMAKQLKGTKKVIWCNNEEPDDKVYLRIMSSILGINEDSIRKNKEKYMAGYKKLLNGHTDRISFYNVEGWTLQDLDRMLSKTDPGLIVIDQGDMIEGGWTKDGADHARLKKLYAGLRKLAKQYAPMIVISQADSSTSWKDKETGEVVYQKWLDQRQLDGSKIGKPGTADLILMIGKDANYLNSRYISIAKNKLRPTTKAHRYLKQEVIFNEEICRYENPE